MCTVTYIPKEEGFILTSTRDEAPERLSEQPKEHSIGSKKLFFPKEPISGGTWIAADRQKVLCLLNGAFIKHKHQPPYKLSRGKMVLEAFSHKDSYEFAGSYDFAGIEPFTLIWAESNALSELRWDSKVLHHKPLGRDMEYIWASCTLYEKEVQKLREQWFEKFLSKHPFPTMEKMINFHASSQTTDNENDMLIRRAKVRSISITAIEFTNAQIDCLHQDLERQSLSHIVW